MEDKYTLRVETEGIEEVTEQVERLADAYDGFPAQVTIKNCRDCTFNIYPSQTRFVEAEGERDMIDTIIAFVWGAWFGGCFGLVFAALIRGNDNDEEMFTE